MRADADGLNGAKGVVRTISTAVVDMSRRDHPVSEPWVLVGGSGFIGTAVAAHLVATGHAVTVVDRHPPRAAVRAKVQWCPLDLLDAESIELPPGRVAILIGSGEARPPCPWTLPLDHVVGTARLAPCLAGRDVVVASSVDVYGWAPGPLDETTAPLLPIDPEQLTGWTAQMAALAIAPCPPHRAAPLCRELAAHDPSGRWVHGLAKRAQELVVATSSPARLRIVRLGEVVAAGQVGLLTTLARDARAGRPMRMSNASTGSFTALDDAVAALVDHGTTGTWNVACESVELDGLIRLISERVGVDVTAERCPPDRAGRSGLVDSNAFRAAGGRITGVADLVDRVIADFDCERSPVFEPPLAIVVPSRPSRPDVVVERQAGALWQGALKSGERWSTEVGRALARFLGLDDDLGVGGGDDQWTVLPTVSGTAALRLAIAAVAGPAEPGQVAVLPSFTFPATAEAVIQLGYRPLFVDIDRLTWTLDPTAVERALRQEPVGVVVGVDTFGVPLDYARLRQVCGEAGVPLVADSAAALGSTTGGRPVGSQADAHAFSMSFAKAVAAGGAGGALALPTRLVARLECVAGWSRSELMAELHAVAALDQLEVVEALIDRRRRLMARYAERLADTGLVQQEASPGTDPVLAHLVVRVVDRDQNALAGGLDGLGIRTKPYFPALHRTSHCDPTWTPEPLAVTDQLHMNTLALPLSSEMTISDVDRVAIGIERVLAALEPAPAGVSL